MTLSNPCLTKRNPTTNPWKIVWFLRRCLSFSGYFIDLKKIVLYDFSNFQVVQPSILVELIEKFSENLNLTNLFAVKTLIACELIFLISKI